YTEPQQQPEGEGSIGVQGTEPVEDRPQQALNRSGGFLPGGSEPGTGVDILEALADSLLVGPGQRDEQRQGSGDEPAEVHHGWVVDGSCHGPCSELPPFSCCCWAASSRSKPSLRMRRSK